MLLQSKLMKIRFWKRKKKQLNIVFSLWTNTLTVEKKGFQLKWTLVAVQSKKKTEFVLFGSWTKKKSYQHWYFFTSKRIRVTSFAFDYRHTQKREVKSSWVLGFCEKSFEKETILQQCLLVHPNLSYVILPENVSKCWSLVHVGKRSTKVLASQKPEFATDSEIDVKNWGKWWTLMLHENAQFLLETFQSARIDSFNWFTFWSLSAFWVLDECVLRIWPRENAAPNFDATPKFWHKIQDSQKSIEYLLNHPRLPLTKSFLQLWDEFKVVYNAHSWP